MGALLPTLLALLAACRWGPVAVPAMLVLLCYVPGRLLIRAARLEGDWDAAGRTVVAVAASLALTPFALNPIWHISNNPWLLLAWAWGLSQAIWWFMRPGDSRIAMDEVRAPPRRLFDHRSTKLLCAALAALVVLATIGTYWPTELRGHPVPSLIHDFIKHHAVLWSLEQQPLPLISPFYAAGSGEVAYYYHFFYLVPATARAVVGDLSIELAFGLQSAVTALATCGLFYLIAKRIWGGDGPGSLAALLCTVVGGLDVVPVLLGRRVVLTLDAWADPVVRIHSFIIHMIWSPQNVTGITILLLAVYVLSRKGPVWRGWFVVGPLFGAALLGATAWIAMIGFAAAAVYCLFEAASKHRQPAMALRQLALSVLIGGLMFAASIPSLLGYAEMSRRLGKSLTTEWPHQWHALLGRFVPPGVLANLLDLPWVLLVELGAALLLPLLLPRSAWKLAWSDPGLRLLIIAALITVAGFVTVRSHFFYNDFGQKTSMVMIAAGALLAAGMINPHRGKPSLVNPLGWSMRDRPRGGARAGATIVAATLLLGLPAGLYATPLTAIRRYFPTEGWFGGLANPIALLAASEAGAYRFLRHELPGDAVLQPDWRADRLHLVQVGRRPLGVTVLEQDTMVFHPGDMAAFERCLREVSEALGGEASAEHCREVLRRYGITHVYVGRVERELWRGVSKFDDERFFRPAFESEGVRIFAVE